MGGKHAYLILCHHQFHQLRSLLRLLDDERNDIYIHADKDCGAFPEEDLRKAVAKSGLFFVKRIHVSWGAYSMVQAELILLESATKGDYDYYHLLSGVDMPLKTQDEIHRFFSEHIGAEFIHYDTDNALKKESLRRVSHYYPFQEWKGRGFRGETNWLRKLYKLPFSLLEKLMDGAQSLLFIDRLGKDRDSFFTGSQWFSVTHAFASHLLTRKAFIEKHFRCSRAPDEAFLQTVVMNSPFRERVANDNLRLIDFKRGSPYTFTSEDYDFLMSSDCLFARKFDETKDPEIIQRISHALSSKA